MSRDAPWVLFMEAPRVQDERYVRARNVPRLVRYLDEATLFRTREAAESCVRASARLRALGARAVGVVI